MVPHPVYTCTCKGSNLCRCAFSNFEEFVINLPVTLGGVSNFKGVMLQARDDRNNVIGYFSSIPFQLKGLTCTWPNGGVTHSSGALKNNLQVVWNAPSDFSKDVTFR